MKTNDFLDVEISTCQKSFWQAFLFKKSTQKWSIGIQNHSYNIKALNGAGISFEL